MRTWLLILILGCGAVLAQVLPSSRRIVSPTPSATASNPAVGTPVLIGTNAVAPSASVNTNGITTFIVGATGVASGDTVFVFFAQDPQTGTAITCADSKGNTYTADADIANGTTTIGARAVLFSAPATTALVIADTITITGMTGAVARAVSVYSASGIIGAGRVDKTSTATGNSTSPSSGATATTTQDNELIMGIIALEARVPALNVLTATGGNTTGAYANSDSGASGTSMAVYPVYQVANSMAAYTASGTITGSARQFAAAIVTYK